MLSALDLAPWDHTLRVRYLDQRIAFDWPIVIESDPATSRNALMQLDGLVRGAIIEYPGELTLYTLLMDLHGNAQESPGYDEQKHAAAIDLAVKRFGNDPEVQRRAQETSSR